jgi:hypothetical protein
VGLVNGKPSEPLELQPNHALVKLENPPLVHEDDTVVVNDSPNSMCYGQDCAFRKPPAKGLSMCIDSHSAFMYLLANRFTDEFIGRVVNTNTC